MRRVVQIPGLTTPLGLVPLLVAALVVSQAFHELGHALAAAWCVASVLSPSTQRAELTNSSLVRQRAHPPRSAPPAPLLPRPPHIRRLPPPLLVLLGPGPRPAHRPPHRGRRHLAQRRPVPRGARGVAARRGAQSPARERCRGVGRDGRGSASRRRALGAFCFLASLRGAPPTSTHALTPLRGLDRPRAVLPARAAPPPRRAHHPPRRPRARRAGARGALAAGAVARGAARGAGAGAGGRLVRADGVVRCGRGGTVRGGAPRGRGDRAVLSPSGGGGGPRRPAPSMLHRPLHAVPRPTHPPRMPRPARPPPPRAGSRSALRRRRVVRRGARLRADGRAREGAADEGGGGGG